MLLKNEFNNESKHMSKKKKEKSKYLQIFLHLRKQSKKLSRYLITTSLSFFSYMRNNDVCLNSLNPKTVC